MEEQLDTVATLREAAEALREYASLPPNDETAARTRNLADRLDALADATRDRPIAWTSQDGIFNVDRQRDEGRSHYAPQCRVDRPDDYNDVPLYLSPCPPTYPAPEADPHEALVQDLRTPSEIAHEGIAHHLADVERESRGASPDRISRVLRCAIRQGRHDQDDHDRWIPFYVLAALREAGRLTTLEH